MKATVRNIKVGTVVKASKLQDEFVPFMKKYIGKEINVSPINKNPGWYCTQIDGLVWIFHESWLDFKTSYTEELRKILKKSINFGGPFLSSRDVDIYTKRIQRLNKKHFGER